MTGTDTETEFVDYSRREFPAENLSFKTGSAVDGDIGWDWEVIYLVGLLEYLDDKESTQVLKCINLALKSGGLAFVGTPSAGSKTIHHRELSADRLSQLLEPHFASVEPYGQNDDFILSSIPQMSFFPMLRCQE